MSDLVCLHPQFTKQEIIKTLKNELNGKERKGKMNGEVKGMETYQDFGKFIAAKRQEKEISLRKLAELLDVSAPYWSDVERGRRIPPTFEKLEQVAKILHLSDSDKSLMYDLAGKGSKRGGLAKVCRGIKATEGINIQCISQILEQEITEFPF